LIELAVASFLGTFAPELRADVVELVEATVPKLVLDVGADDTGGVFRAEGEELATPAT
jgi:hypothetical protein